MRAAPGNGGWLTIRTAVWFLAPRTSGFAPGAQLTPGIMNDIGNQSASPDVLDSEFNRKREC
jgi:hypothetical protein